MSTCTKHDALGFAAEHADHDLRYVEDISIARPGRGATGTGERPHDTERNRMTPEEQDARLDAADHNDYLRWIEFGSSGMTTLELRGAQHAAERAGEREDARRLANEIADREALGR